MEKGNAGKGKEGVTPYIYDEEIRWDLSTLGYSDWLDFFFDHPITDAEKEGDWYWQDEWEYKVSDSRVVLDYLIELVTHSQILLERYSEDQIESGFWCMLCGPMTLISVIWDQRIPFERRAYFIRQNATLFRDFFSENPLNTISFMWWDLLEQDYDMKRRPVDADDAAIQETILLTLGEILGMEESHCVRSALHGLNHLHHPRVPEFIDYFLATKQGLDKDIRAYALKCREGRSQ